MFGVAGSDESLSLIEMSDGTYTVHKSTDGLLAAEYAVGDWRITATGNDQGIDVNANAAVGVGLTGAVATEWNFSSRADAEAFIDTWGGPAAAAGNGGIPVIGIGIERGRELGRVITGKRPPEPDIIHISGGATIHGSGRASDLYGIGASAAVQFSDVTGVSVDRGENEITVFTEVDLSSEFGGQFAVAGKSDSLQGNASASIGLTFDSSGSVTQVQVQAAATSEASGVVQMLAQASGRPVSAPLADHPGEGVVYTANVPVSARNEAWARGIAAQSAMAAPSAVVPGGYGVYTATRYDIAQEIIAQAARDGDTTAVFGTVDRSGLFDLGIAAKVSGVGFGLGTSGSTESRSGGDAYYLADHGWKRWTLCAR
ncbi:MAG: hypothetical protein FWD18_05600 [Micrococcales bacterium]|nr:hypothetical protein [Micrococcales bacterium]